MKLYFFKKKKNISFFILNSVLGPQQISKIEDTLAEFNLTTIAEPYYSTTLNAAYQIVLNSEFPVYGEPSLQIAPVMIDTAYGIDSKIHELHAINNNLHNNSAKYSTVFEELMFKDACPTIVEEKAVS